MPLPTYAEFFAGGGMVRAGLGDSWRCVLANDIDPAKCEAYRANWGSDHLIEGDVAQLDPRSLQRSIDLYWASSPCQDFSLAGKGAGLAGGRSGIFSDWMKIFEVARVSGFAPKLVAFENVTGLVSRNKGRDFSEVLCAFIRQGYRIGAVEINAEHFLPQSRPRVFVIAAHNDLTIADHLIRPEPSLPFHSKGIQTFLKSAAPDIKQSWIWWNLALPGKRTTRLADLLDFSPQNDWMTESQMARLLSLMSEVNVRKLKLVQSQRGTHIGTVYKRGRPDSNGIVRQRAEVRFDGVAGCLRTPAGGSSRQTLLIVGDGQIKGRLLSAREAVRLMGLDDSYQLSNSYNKSYKLAGDGVAVPVVRHLSRFLLQPLIGGTLAAKVA